LVETLDQFCRAPSLSVPLHPAFAFAASGWSPVKFLVKRAGNPASCHPQAAIKVQFACYPAIQAWAAATKQKHAELNQTAYFCDGSG